jgi:hypothetical protein
MERGERAIVGGQQSGLEKEVVVRGDMLTATSTDVEDL